MPITFKSKSGANILMLDAIGMEMLKMLDFGTRIPGAIRAEDLPLARDNLQNALAALPAPAPQDSEEDDPPISPKTRALPLLQLIEAAIADGEYLRWD